MAIGPPAKARGACPDFASLGAKNALRQCARFVDDSGGHACDPRTMARTSIALLLLLLWSGTAAAADFYVDPGSGSPSGDGSQAKPWQTLEGVVQAGHLGSVIHPGDTVWLKTGYHGAFAAKGGSYATPITVAAEAGEKPTLSRVSFTQTHGWALAGLSISPSYAPDPH